MDKREIIGRNIERFQRMLQAETHEATRRSIENAILEFEIMLSPAPRKDPGVRTKTILKWERLQSVSWYPRKSRRSPLM